MDFEQFKADYIKCVERDVRPVADEAWEAFDDAYSDDERMRVLWTHLNKAYALGATAGRADAIAQAIEQVPELEFRAVMLGA